MTKDPALIKNDISNLLAPLRVQPLDFGGCEKFASPKSLKACGKLNTEVDGHNVALERHISDRANAVLGEVDPVKAVEVLERLRHEAIELPAEAVRLIEERRTVRAQLLVEFAEFRKARESDLAEARTRAATEADRIFGKPADSLTQLQKSNMVEFLCRDAVRGLSWRPAAFYSPQDAADLQNARAVLGRAFSEAGLFH